MATRITISPHGPIVLEPVRLLDLIEHALEQTESLSTIVVCSSREAFLARLQPSTGGDDNPESVDTRQLASRANEWSTPTLRLLASSRQIRLAFCRDVTHLRAYLASYGYRDLSNGSSLERCGRRLIVVDPIYLHKTTSAYSAQGLSRTFSIAVEATAQANARLILAECFREDTADAQDASVVDEEEANTAATSDTKPWDEEVSILNVTTKTFGAGERGWVGRTVKIRAIAERWCKFTTLPAEMNK